ncbi:RNA 2',3'-cyclic phosphodiesterase, partial [bacterium]|nr:RNA 2',3'-cyclic phosphodiesterase [bacterium]
MRLFFAVALPDAVRERLAGLVSELKEKVPDAPVGWVVSGNVHLTLRFLGDVDDATLPRLVAAGEEAARAAAPLELELAGVGTFGGRASPRVIWIGITEGDGLASLKKIAEGLEG